MRKHLPIVSPRRELRAIAAVFLFALVSVHAQVKDYSRGFQEFYKLGFPDAAKADYVNVSAYRSVPDMDMGGLYELRLQGNGWMLEETPKVKGRFIVGTCRVMEIYDQEALMKEQQKKVQACQPYE
jgi:DNA-binding transcriptional regulator of glucitol operon